MKIENHTINNSRIAEIIYESIIIQNSDDAVDLLGNIYYQGYNKVIVYEKNLSADFFDLKNKMAGEILQKFSNYGVQLAIIGDFSKYTSKSLRDFIYESNKYRNINFLNSIEEALNRLLGKN